MPDGDGEGSGVVTPDAADEAETRPTSPADEPEPNELLDALTEAWTAARTEGGDGTEKPVPNAEGWSIYWTERPGGSYRDRYVRAPDNTIFRSLTQIRHVVEVQLEINRVLQVKADGLVVSLVITTEILGFDDAL